MKKFLLILITIVISTVPCYATESESQALSQPPIDNIALLTQQGFFSASKPASSLNPYDEIRRTFCTHLKYSNSYQLESLKTLYATKYINADGLNRDVYFDLVKKTWESYPDIKYKMDIRNIEINDNVAEVQIHEVAYANTNSKSGIVNENGVLESVSDGVYYLEKIDNQWLVTSDYILFEKTSLKYGSAKGLEINLSAPIQIPANTSYTTTLKITPPKDSFVIASIGHENITYPQSTAEEVFRKLPEDGILERMSKSNGKNLNEYAVASFGITKAEIQNGRELKIYVTGLGFIMNRVNVIPHKADVKLDVRNEVKDSKNGEAK